MKKENLSDEALGALFEAEKETAALPDNLMARIMADAEAQQAHAAVPTPKSASVFRFSWNWLPSAGALAACICAGLFIGLGTELTSKLGVLSDTSIELTDAFGGVGNVDSIFVEEQS